MTSCIFRRGLYDNQVVLCFHFFHQLSVCYRSGVLCFVFRRIWGMYPFAFQRFGAQHFVGEVLAQRVTEEIHVLA